MNGAHCILLSNLVAHCHSEAGSCALTLATLDPIELGGAQVEPVKEVEIGRRVLRAGKDIRAFLFEIPAEIKAAKNAVLWTLYDGEKSYLGLGLLKDAA